jgi:hypothetical protein
VPMVYTSSLATPGVTTTNAGANTETGVISYKFPTTGTVGSAALSAFYCIGAANAFTSINGIRFRVATFTTASTAGTSTTPSPRDQGMQASLLTVVTGQTISTTGRKNHLIFGCGVGGPGGWVAQNPDAVVRFFANITTAPSIDVVSVAANLSLNYEWSSEHVE